MIVQKHLFLAFLALHTGSVRCSLASKYTRFLFRNPKTTVLEKIASIFDEPEEYWKEFERYYSIQFCSMVSVNVERSLSVIKYLLQQPGQVNN